MKYPKSDSINPSSLLTTPPPLHTHTHTHTSSPFWQLLASPLTFQMAHSVFVGSAPKNCLCSMLMKRSRCAGAFSRQTQEAPRAFTNWNDRTELSQSLELCVPFENELVGPVSLDLTDVKRRYKYLGLNVCIWTGLAGLNEPTSVNEKFTANITSQWQTGAN